MSFFGEWLREKRRLQDFMWRIYPIVMQNEGLLRNITSDIQWRWVFGIDQYQRFEEFGYSMKEFYTPVKKETPKVEGKQKDMECEPPTR